MVFIMPTYNYSCKECSHKFERFCKISERNIPTIEECPGCSRYNTIVQHIGSPRIVSNVGSILSKTSDGWNDVLKSVKSGSGRNNSIHVK